MSRTDRNNGSDCTPNQIVARADNRIANWLERAAVAGTRFAGGSYKNIRAITRK